MNTELIYRTMVDYINDGVYFVDLDRRIHFWNTAAEEITGYSADEIIGKCCQDSNLNHIDAEGRPLCELLCPLFSTNVDGQVRAANVYVRHKNGYRVPIHVKTFPVMEGEKIIGSIEVFNLTNHTKYNDNLVESLSEISMHDSLTRLPNRRYLQSFLEYKFHEYIRYDRLFTVLFADIDDFRDFNNLYGHEAGDEVLKQMAELIHRFARQEDLIGRWSGDEFIGICAINNEEEMHELGEKFQQMVAEREFTYKGQPLTVTVSLGLAVIKKQDSPEEIVRRADRLMYEGKQAGKNSVRYDTFDAPAGHD